MNQFHSAGWWVTHDWTKQFSFDDAVMSQSYVMSNTTELQAGLGKCSSNTALHSSSAHLLL
jgi:hypothetical protein